MSNNILGIGMGSKNSNGGWLEVYYPKELIDPIDQIKLTTLEFIDFKEGEECITRPLPNSLVEYLIKNNLVSNDYSSLKINDCVVVWINDQLPPYDVPSAYLMLHLLSHRFVKPNKINLEGIFNILPTVAWTSDGPKDPKDLEEILTKKRINNEALHIHSLDKFPCLTDYVIPEGVRIADSHRVRLGAYLGEGTTVMHEGFINFNAGTLGKSMVEGRISQGVVVGEGSDLGGSSSTMGTLSGGNETLISVGKDCLLGANSGIGIPLGDRCVIEAGLYITSGTKVEIIKSNNEVKEIKASELSYKDDLLFIRNSLTGTVQCKPNPKTVNLNEELHSNN